VFLNVLDIGAKDELACAALFLLWLCWAYFRHEAFILVLEAVFRRGSWVVGRIFNRLRFMAHRGDVSRRTNSHYRQDLPLLFTAWFFGPWLCIDNYTRTWSTWCDAGAVERVAQSTALFSTVMYLRCVL